MAITLDSKVREFIAVHRVARLATASANGEPHVIPVCYAFDGYHVYSALDLKAKRVGVRRLQRLRNVSENSRVSLVIDDYSEDWSSLAYVLIRGEAVILDSGEERARAEALLRDKYPQYRTLLEKGCIVLRISPQKVVQWGRV